MPKHAYVLQKSHYDTAVTNGSVDNKIIFFIEDTGQIFTRGKAFGLPKTGANTITTVGTISTGTWQGTKIGVAYGGTGLTTLTPGGILYGKSASEMAVSAAGTAGQILVSGGAGAPEWKSTSAVSVGTASKVANSFVITIGGGSVEGTSKYSFDGSAAKAINFAAGTNITLTTAAGAVTIGINQTDTVTADGTALVTSKAVSDYVLGLNYITLNAIEVTGTGNAVTGATKASGKVTLSKGNVVLPSGTWTADRILVSASNYGVSTSYSILKSTSNWTANDTTFATTSSIQNYIDTRITSSLNFKGTIGTGGTITALPSSGVKVGDTYKVITAGTYANQKCEPGDMIIATATTPTWSVVQNNLDVFTGATASANGTVGYVVAPQKGQQGYLLSGAGTWVAPSTLTVKTAEYATKIGNSSASYTYAQITTFMEDNAWYDMSADGTLTKTA